MPTFRERLAHAWNSFNFVQTEAYTRETNYSIGSSSSSRPDRPRFTVGGERTIVSSIYTRMSVDCAAVRIEHVRNNKETGQYEETIKSGLNECLNVRANIDQFGRHFRQDMPLTLFQKGTIAILPVDTTLDPNNGGGWDVKSLRVGIITDYYPEHVGVRAYNEKKGYQEDLIVSKYVAAIVENPFYSVMNEPNSTLQRLIRKLSLLDHVDEISSSGKLDIIIQLPYVVKSETKQTQAENRRKQLEEQLTGSTYGIAYADATEKITQLNRAVENNLLTQVQYLKDQVYEELGITAEIMDGTADDITMLNYINRIVEPVIEAITEAMAGTFLTKTARAQGQSISYFQTPFKLLPISKLADVVDVLSRNQIVTPNEIRPTLGLKPSKQPQADQLVNSNMPLKDQVTGEVSESEDDPADIEEANLDRTMTELGIS